MKRRRNIIQRIIGVLVLLIAGSAVTLMSCASFGAKVSGQRLERVKASRHSQDGKFLNALPLSSVGWGEIWDFLGERLFGDQLRHPPLCHSYCERSAWRFHHSAPARFTRHVDWAFERPR